MQTAQLNQRIVVGGHSGLLQFCAEMDKIAAHIKALTEPFERGVQFIVEQYANSALGKQRAAKLNLTIAQYRHTLATWRERTAQFVEHANTPHTPLRELLDDLQQANAPNIYSVKSFASLRQQQTKAGR